MPRAPKPTKTERKHRTHLHDLMRQLEWDLAEKTRAWTRIPTEWHEIGTTRYPDHKMRITLNVETSVVRFFKSMGAGYQTRMNDVLASFVHARLARYVKGPEDVLPTKVEKRPEMGEFELHVRQLKAYMESEKAQLELLQLGTTAEEFHQTLLAMEGEDVGNGAGEVAG